MTGCHVPAGLDPWCAAVAGSENQADGGAGPCFCSVFSSQMQAAHRCQARRFGQFGHRQRDRAAAQNFLQCPKQIERLIGVDEGEAPRLYEGAHAIGIEAIPLPRGGDPENRATRGRRHGHRQHMARRPAKLMQARQRQGHAIQHRQGRAGVMCFASQQRCGHAHRLQCSLNVLNSELPASPPGIGGDAGGKTARLCPEREGQGKLQKMKKNQLGRTGIEVSALCLGSMTWGSQNTTGEGHAQIDRALEQGINFIDTAEMYPVNPVAKETIGRTEEVIGDWFAESGRRDEVVLASKHSGEGMAHARDGAPISSKTIPEAVEESLRRLKTDYIDLYQFHWPNRGSYMFRKNWTYDPSGQDRAETLAHMEEALGALAREVEAGRIRAFGLSNESAWGTAQWLRLAEAVHGPRVAAIQNEYSLMCRLFDTDLAELSVNEDVGLLAFSPLAAGLLSGKYQGGALPDGSRMTINTDLGGRRGPRAFAAVDAYLAVARKHGLDPVQMALAWCLTRPFMCSAIFGATSMAQLDLALGAVDVVLEDAVLADLDAAHRAHPMPF